MSTRVATSTNQAVVLGSTPTNISQYSPGTINNGPENPCYIESGQLKFRPGITVTSSTGITRTVDLQPISATGLGTSTYKIVIPDDSDQPYLANCAVRLGTEEPFPLFRVPFCNYGFYAENNYMKLVNNSIVPFPAGMSGGKPVFRYETVPYLEFTNTTWGDGTAMPCILKDGNGNFGFYTYYENQWYCQTTQPTVAGAWYNPTTNLIKFSDDGTTWTTYNVSLPLGLCTHVYGTGFTNVFLVWSCDNVFWIDSREPYTVKVKNKTTGYDNWTSLNGIVLNDSLIHVTAGVVDSIWTQPTYNESGLIPNQKMITTLSDISDQFQTLSLGATGAWYTAPDDGYVYFFRNAHPSTSTTTTVNIGIYHERTGTYQEDRGNMTWGLSVIQRVAKNDRFQVSYTADGGWIFRFYYMKSKFPNYVA